VNKLKIINDPVYGFIKIPYEIIYDIIEHPYFQRLRRIQQLGLTNLVYPGALHTRFHHALGTMHLMQNAIKVLRSKEVEITDEEAEAVTIAILLHDIGHGPFSHALEHAIVSGMHHEHLSLAFMKELNDQFDGRLSLAIEIFESKYHKKFLHQLVSSQLDMDRLDYLTRDSFFTGVYEGVVGYDRIIQMLNVKEDRLVIDEKGIYSVEKFLIARRLMYWQVYLHKTVLAAETVLTKILQRAKELCLADKNIFITENLHYFFTKKKYLESDRPEVLQRFSKLDDYDVYFSIKEWQKSDDYVLASLSRSIIDRKIFKTILQNEPIASEKRNEIKARLLKNKSINENNLAYFMIEGTTANAAYNLEIDSIKILKKDGSLEDVALASDQFNIKNLANAVVKHYLCYFGLK